MLQNSDVAGLIVLAVGLVLNLVWFPSLSFRSRVSPLFLPGWLAPLALVLFCFSELFHYLVLLSFTWLIWVKHKGEDQSQSVASTPSPLPEMGELKLSVLPKGVLGMLRFWPVLFLFMVLTSMAMSQYPAQGVVTELKSDLETRGLAIVPQWFLLVCILAPLIEEFLFRGVLYPLLKKHVGVFWGCVLSSLAFALSHQNLRSFVVLFLLGAFLTYSYEKNNNILVPMTSHAFFNALMLGIMLSDVA